MVAKQVGLPPRVAQTVLDQMLAHTAGVIEDVSNGAIAYDPRRTRDWVRLLKQRPRLVEGG